MEKILAKIKKFIPKKIFLAGQPLYHFSLNWLAALIYRFPANNLIVIGVTGTTGKTTTVYLIAQMLKTAGYKVGFTSTAFFADGQKEWLNDKKMTMVGRFFTQKILRQMVANGCQYAIIETTSEGIRQFRHRFINYDILIFTGLYPEHIESHGSFLKYKQAKQRLFLHLRHCRTKYADENKKVKKAITNISKINYNRVKKTIIANLDDEHSLDFLKFWAEEKYGFSAQKPPAKAKEIKNLQIIPYQFGVQQGRAWLEVQEVKINLSILGNFNASNAMAAVCLGLSQSLPLAIIKKGLEAVKAIAGRLEVVAEKPFKVIVDYAFEPRALGKLYQTISAFKPERIIHVLGSAGGGRDIARRPLLGQIAGQKADIVIVTNEDPYDDDPLTIIDQVAFGAEKQGKKVGQDLFKILDRRQAIKKALALARPNDLVLITGKGSEQFICGPAGQKIPWDDRKVVKEILTKSAQT